MMEHRVGTEAELHEALEGAGARGGVLQSVCFSGDFQWPELPSDIGFDTCRFERTGFAGADLEGARFEACEFSRCVFRGANVRDTVWVESKFYLDETPCDFRYAELRDARFEDCDLTTCSFERSSAYGLVLRRCQAQGVDFSGADFSLALSRNNTMIDFSCSDSNLAYADFSSSCLAGAEFRGTRLVHARLQNCDLRGATLAECQLDNIEGEQLVLAQCDLRGSTFNSLDPRRIDLSGAKVDVDQALALLAAMGIDVC